MSQSAARAGLRDFLKVLFWAAVVLLIVSIFEWQTGLFLAAMGVTLLASASPLVFASWLVSKSLARTADPTWSLNWRRALGVVAALLISFALAYVSYRVSLLVVGAISDDPQDFCAVAGAGAAMALWALAFACVSVVPILYLFFAVLAAVRSNRRRPSGV